MIRTCKNILIAFLLVICFSCAKKLPDITDESENYDIRQKIIIKERLAIREFIFKFRLRAIVLDMMAIQNPYLTLENATYQDVDRFLLTYNMPPANYEEWENLAKNDKFAYDIIATVNKEITNAKFEISDLFPTTIDKKHRTIEFSANVLSGWSDMIIKEEIQGTLQFSKDSSYPDHIVINDRQIVKILPINE